jgi:hypothetical protein
VVVSMLLSRDPRGSGHAWRRQHVVWAVFFLSLTQVLYTGLNVICLPIKDSKDLADLAKQCTLGVEGFAAASRYIQYRPLSGFWTQHSLPVHAALTAFPRSTHCLSTQRSAI